MPGYGQWRRSPPVAIDDSGPILVAVSVTNLQGIYLADPQSYRFLDNREPLSRLDGSIWIWDISADATARRLVEGLAHLANPGP